MRINRTALATGLLVAGLFGTALSVRGDGPDRFDVRPTGRGNRVRGLSARHNAGTGSTTTTNGIDYHGGPVMHTTNLYYVLYGNWSSTDATGQAILENWARLIAPSPYFNINTTYTDTTGAVPNAVAFMGTHIDTGSLGTSLNDVQIGQLVTNAINAGFPGSPNSPGVPDPNGLYMVLTAPGVAENSGFLTQYCGWHWSGAFSNHAVQVGLIGSTNVMFA